MQVGLRFGGGLPGGRGYDLSVQTGGDFGAVRPAVSKQQRRVLFVTRNPMIHQIGGSTTYALNLLEQLRREGCAVEVVVTAAASRSATLWFTVRATLPAGVKYVVPGMWRVGRVYVNAFSVTAWSRLLVRLAARLPMFGAMARMVQRMRGERLVSEAWDLTPPTERERRVAVAYAEKTKATTVIVNYAHWGPLFDEAAMHGRRRVILMHDLLHERVQRFLAAGMPLDCRFIDAATEIGWLDHADCLLAAQVSEAAAVRERVSGKVLVQPLGFAGATGLGEVVARRCLFVGSNIVPNRMGVEWFVQYVWPLVLEAEPAAEFVVVGSVCGAAECVRVAEVAGVSLLGVVERLEDAYAAAEVCVVPLLVGSGIKVKLVEALSYAKATVSTRVGVQGLEAWAEGVVEVTDDAAEFATKVVRLMQNAGERRRLERAGRVLAEEHFGVGAGLSKEFVECVLGS